MKKNENNIVIVGDSIKEQVKNSKIVGFKDYVKNSNKKNKLIFSVGQGLKKNQIDTIKELLSINIKKANTDLTHKKDEKNIMITEPHKIAENNYISELMIDDSCSEMSDHLTGQHIQAMVLIEAARQMNIAVAEKYLISKDSKKNVGFVLHKMETNFRNYIYPLSVSMRYHIKKIRRMPTGHFKSNATIKFIQNNKCSLEINLEYSVTDKLYLESKEIGDIEELVSNISSDEK